MAARYPARLLLQDYFFWGESLHTLAVLSGYGLLWLELKDTDCHIVIRKSYIS